MQVIEAKPVEELPLDAIRELIANQKLFQHYSYEWRAERRILPNDFGRTRADAPPGTLSFGCLIAKRREAGRDFAIAEEGVKLLVEREGQVGAPAQCYILLRDESGALINSIRAQELYSRPNDKPTNPPLREGLGNFWWIDERFNFVGRGAPRREEGPF